MPSARFAGSAVPWGVCTGVALFLCATQRQQLHAQQAVLSARQTQPASGETVGQALRRLARASSSELKAEDIVLRAVLEFTRALGRLDGVRAVALIEAAGYQPLPFEGELPERPVKPISRQALQLVISQRAPAGLDELPVAAFEVRDRNGIRAVFPAVGEWMLPSDWAVVVQPVSGFEGWVRRPACVVVRLRARKPAIMGGNLLEALGIQP